MHHLITDDDNAVLRFSGQGAGCVAVQENWKFTPEELEALFDTPILRVAP